MDEYDFSLWVIPPTGKKHSSAHIEDFMIKVIKSGAVVTGETVPSHRVIARLNNVNRNTTLRAFTKLIATGWLAHTRGSKATVAETLPDNRKQIFRSIVPELLPKPLQLAEMETLGMEKSSPLDFIQVGTSAFQNRPDYLRKAFYVSSRKRMELQTTYSSEKFTKNIFTHLKLRGISVHLEQLLVIRGRGDCLKCIFKALHNENNIVVNTAPCDKMVCSIIKQFSRNSIGIEMGTPDLLEKIEQLLEKTKIGILYLRPNACYPTCRSLDDATCLRLVELAKKYRFYIIEEDDDHEFWWKKHPFKPLVCYDHDGFVIHCSSLSRTSPYMQHLRTVIGPGQLIGTLRTLPDIRYGYQDYIEEKNINQLLNDNGLISVSRQARLSKQKDIKKLHQILQLQLGAYINYELPENGTAIWISFPKLLDLKRIFEQLKNDGFRLKFSTNQKRQNTSIQSMRLDISNFNEEECRRIAIRLRTLFKNR
ncbi:hypothetical protein ACQKCH_11260 [Nubsella zeaxanthinifaciens]|uniref:hypothetical protein n=1 Tax=Nubsella zeaxanthinifaciens TaxID=392412 RepID=UPI003D03C98B